jgi:protein involved in polysaccharide export with SLBB domain
VSTGVVYFASNNAVNPSLVFSATNGATATLGFNTNDALYLSGGNFGIADGYMEYPLVTVYLKEVKSKKYLVSGEVLKPGSYPLEDNTTVLKAISIAGGFSKYGNASRVKVLRQKAGGR